MLNARDVDYQLDVLEDSVIEELDITTDNRAVLGNFAYLSV